MLVTALSPVIGYDKASAIAHTANDGGPDLEGGRAPVRSRSTKSAFDEIIDPGKMVGRGVGGS